MSDSKSLSKETKQDAGMGRQSVCLPEDSNHTEISKLLVEAFPKMRKLSVIPPEAEGYTAKALKTQSGGGKTTLYIMPLQETLDTSPLPPDSQHFSKMSKMTCYQCNEVMPLQMLAVHIKTCSGKSASDETDAEEEENVSEQDIDVTEDVLHHLSKQVNKNMEFKLCVDREGLPDRGILQWQRKKSSSPAGTLKVVYIGEAGVDTGAMKREFLTDMISGIENRFFEGAETQGKNPKYSLTDLDNENFRTVGEIMAVSIAQGGPAPAFLKEWCNRFLCHGEIDLGSLSKKDVTDRESSFLITRVSIQHAIILHSTTRLIPMLQQLRKGMELYGLVKQMEMYPDACHPLFVPGNIVMPDADFIMMSCEAQFSERGTSRERSERRILNFLQDFCERIDPGNEAEAVGIKDVLQWLTGQSHIPILPDEKRHFKIICDFDHNCSERFGNHSICYPIVSACTKTVTFPVQHLSTYAEFVRLMREAIRYGGGFHRV
uniref:HECT domain-containing protein n=1 Tax=Oryzias melastigma TaxID=30732 RepID=A0A3B3CM35_ORYME